MYIDSHCHLNFPELKSQIKDIRAAMASAKVTHAMVISTTLEEFPSVHELATTYDNFWATVGVHPDNETMETVAGVQIKIQEPTVDDLLTRAALPKVVGIGETGLDYYRLNGRSIADMEWQRERFRVHIRAAQICQKPLIIHTRSSADDTMAILREMGEDGAGSHRAGGVFHCFTESVDVARIALDLGFYISFSGIVTFKNALSIKDSAAFVPLDRCLIETDSPYLAPTPYRGKTNTPAYVPYVAAELARLKGLSVEEVARVTGDNYFNLFKGAAR
jgi:TatD DNase family protein